MNDLKNLEEVLEMLKAQEDLMDILERQQNEIEKGNSERKLLQEQLDGSMQLNGQLMKQIEKLKGQIVELKNLAEQ